MNTQRFKYNIEYCQKIAKQRGGECLSKTYRGTKHNMIWKCSQGHVLATSFYNFKRRKRFCSKCDPRCINLDDCKSIAKKLGGFCLSEEYINNKSLMTWKCFKGHIWEASVFKIKQGNWCKICEQEESQILATFLKECEEYAYIRGKKCIGHKFVNGQTRMVWSCRNGHIWESPFSIMKAFNSWCPQCFVKLDLLASVALSASPVDKA